MEEVRHGDEKRESVGSEALGPEAITLWDSFERTHVRFIGSVEAVELAVLVLEGETDDNGCHANQTREDCEKDGTGLVPRSLGANEEVWRVEMSDSL